MITTAQRKVKYVVVDEHTLCYVFEEEPNMGLILAASLVHAKLFGRAKTASPYNVLTSGPLPVADMTQRVRMANLNDFEIFRISIEGFQKDSFLQHIYAQNPDVDEPYNAQLW